MATANSKSQSKSSKSSSKPKIPKVVPYKGNRPFVTVVAGNKGGVGKSTVVKLLAAGLSGLNAKVAVFDLEEPEWPLSQFFKDRIDTAEGQQLDLMSGLSFRELPRNTSTSKLRTIIEGLEDTHYVFIDTPAYNPLDGLDLISVADLVLCPGVPSRESMVKFEVFLPTLMKKSPGTPVRAFWNNVMLSESLQHKMVNATAGQELYGCPVLSTYLTHRAAQTAANAFGMTLLEFSKPSDPGFENFTTFLADFCAMSREIAISKNKESA